MDYNKKFRIKFWGVRSRIIGTSNKFDDCVDIMFKFLEERKYKSYYQRYWIENNAVHIDVGSHTEFFEISRKDKKDITEDYYEYVNRTDKD